MCAAIAAAVAVDEILDIHDRMRAIEAAARVAKNRDAEADAAVIRLRAERRLGEMLAQTKRHRGGRPKTGSENEQVSEPRLADIGVDRKLSARAQKLFAVPAADFDQHIAEFREEVRELGGRVSAKLIREGEKAQRRAERHQTVEGGGTVENLYALATSGYQAGTIGADPAWAYETWGEGGQDRSPVQHYHTESLAEIKSRPVALLAAPNSVLHLWCPSSMFDQGLEVIDAWEFTYIKIGFIWVKTTLDGSSPKMITGHWTRDEAEVCLFATRGNPDRLDAGVRQVIQSPALEHSAKPDEWRERMRRLTCGPYLELYGRKPYPGFTVWGDQVAWVPPGAAGRSPYAPPPQPRRPELDAAGIEIPGFLRGEQ